MYRERRSYPRFFTRLKATVTGSSGRPVTALVTDVSLGGLRLDLDYAALDELAPPGSRQDPGWELSMRLEVKVAGGEPRAILACGQVVYSRRTSETTCVLGLRYAGFQGDSARAVADWVAGLAAGA